MAEFKVMGPYKVSTKHTNSGARVVLKNDFWDESDERRAVKEKYGIYVFAIKPPRTSRYTPCYVGQATDSFGNETFQNDKILKYEHALGDYKSGAPYLFFLVHPATRKNLKQISQLEDYLISMGFAANPDIQNDKGTKLPGWSISGVIRSSVRRPTDRAKQLAEMFKI